MATWGLPDGKAAVPWLASDGSMRPAGREFVLWLRSLASARADRCADAMEAGDLGAALDAGYDRYYARWRAAR